MKLSKIGKLLIFIIFNHTKFHEVIKIYTIITTFPFTNAVLPASQFQRTASRYVKLFKF